MSKKTIKVNCEFASELICVIPYVNWLHENNQLDGVITSKGMKPFYYFCDNVEEVFEYRTFDINSNGLNDVPNNWVHHNAEAVFGKPYGEMSEKEQTLANGVLDYSQWTPPSYKNYYNDNTFDNLKPYIVINNNYNVEFGNSIEDSRRYFDLQTLSAMFYYFHDSGYNVIYKRPNNTEFTPDQNEIATLQGGYEFKEFTDAGIITDYQLCNYYDNVFNINDMEYDNYNEFQLRCFSNAEGFITTNGGGGILTCYFDKKVLFYVPHGKELRDGYLTKENSYVNKLSDAKVHVVLDKEDKNDYTKILNKIKDIF